MDIASLEEGNRQFVKKGFSSDVGLSPRAAILTCMDSRIAPENLFRCSFGDFFTIRVAGNIASEDVLGSLEAALSAGVSLFVVLGHTDCKAIQAVLNNVQLPNFESIREKISAAKDHSNSNDPTEIAKANAIRVASELKNGSSMIAGALDTGKLKIAAGLYDVKTGKVEFLI